VPSIGGSCIAPFRKYEESLERDRERFDGVIELKLL
jgi:hypothetical protein